MLENKNPEQNEEKDAKKGLKRERSQIWTESPLIQCSHKISITHTLREVMLQLGSLIWKGLLVTSIKMKSEIRKGEVLFEINSFVGLEAERKSFRHFRINGGRDSALSVQPSLQSDALSEAVTNSLIFCAADILASVLYSV